MDDRQVINVIKDTLQTYLEDPRQQYTNSSRAWVHTDEPLASATYPRVQVTKRGPSSTRIIDIGWEFMEQYELVVDITFYTKIPFKWKNTDDTYLQDEELVKAWLPKIWSALKGQFSTLHTTYGVTGWKNLGETEPVMVYNVSGEPTQLYKGIVSVRVWYFTTCL